MSQSGLSQIGKIPPAISVLLELQAGGGGARIDSTTENCSCQSVPYSGTARDGGEGEILLSGGNEDLGLVVGGDQDAYKSRQ